MPAPMLKAIFTGQADLIDLSDGTTTLRASFYALAPILEKLHRVLPPPCPECEGQGDIVLEERDLVVCGACKGTRVSPRRYENCEGGQFVTVQSPHSMEQLVLTTTLDVR